MSNRRRIRLVMDGMNQERGWICPGCESAASGDRCMKCGAYAPFTSENSVAPGSYADAIGWPRTAAASRGFGLLLMPLLAAMLYGVLAYPPARGWILLIAGIILFRALIWERLLAFALRTYGRSRFGR